VPSCSADVSHALKYRATPRRALVCFNCSPAVGTNAAIANEEGFGTLSRQLGNDEGYSSFCVDVSGPEAARRPHRAERAKDARNGFDA
jgi:hypothetical protein